MQQGKHRVDGRESLPGVRLYSGLCAGSLHCLLQQTLLLQSPGGGERGSLAKSTSLEGKSALTLHNLGEGKELISIA